MRASTHNGLSFQTYTVFFTLACIGGKRATNRILHRVVRFPWIRFLYFKEQRHPSASCPHREAAVAVRLDTAMPVSISQLSPACVTRRFWIPWYFPSFLQSSILSPVKLIVAQCEALNLGALGGT
jgi:hypothetical protein